ncbi:MAG TPA: AbrB/MazE/SpoVT family DNA-binding domain-containing protein [Candidatus Saccharimonadales bacterium]|nr:AbrB/MazE/SpoVT family DNA-binding domain-containing protein [Candidatus Saccharimonadales bacterium]
MKTITLTSKNQITIPAELVRQLKLDKNRRLEVEKRGKTIMLTPEISVEERLEAHWAKMSKYIKRSLSDEDIRRAREEAHEERADRLLRRVRQS